MRRATKAKQRRSRRGQSALPKIRRGRRAIEAWFPRLSLAQLRTRWRHKAVEAWFHGLSLALPRTNWRCRATKAWV
ncbi:hypothetical protein B296_00042525 [Ensete ventricosum]|uniref:Uncharacterized protein n=1 Tax=Ensete ventricosum TaxID=4639 RepID=A0A426X585_ENSVE|nr:hypothetical protein B296_00042525 [Ensete ventricosum]